MMIMNKCETLKRTGKHALILPFLFSVIEGSVIYCQSLVLPSCLLSSC